MERARHVWMILCFTALLVAASQSIAAPPSHAKTTAAVNVTALHPGETGVLAFVCEVQEGYHAQSHTPSEKFYIAFTVTITPNPGIDLEPVVYPGGKDETYAGLGKLNVYTGKVIVYVPFKVHADAAVGDLKLAGTAKFQICDDHACYPPERPAVQITVPIVAAGTSASPNQPELFTGYTPEPPTTQPATSPATQPAASVDVSGPLVSKPANTNLVVALATALLTGLLFNVMPCVLPVVPLKIMGFYEVSQHNRAKSIGLGAVFSAGLIASFGVLAILVVVMRVLDWGGLFQKTWFTLIMVIVLTAMAISSFGFFTVNLPTGIYRFTPRHDTYTGNFLFGVLTAALSTPCTFGLFVGLLATALSQPAWIGVMLIMTVGVGMAAPYFVLSAIPEVARNLPRAGPWAEVVKQMLAFMLLATAVYFAQPLFERFVSDRVFWWTMFGVVAAAAAFLIVRSTQLSSTWKPRALAVVIAVLLVIPALGAVRRLTSRPYEWVAFSESAVASARAADKPVLIDFTASWCGNCHWVEAYVLHDPRVIDAIRSGRVVMIKADVTDDDSLAKPLLAKLSPAQAIPLTAVYLPGTSEPKLLDGIYGVDDLLRTMRPGS